MIEELFYIQNKGFVGNCLMWWHATRSGYTCNLDTALKVTRAEAEQICRTRPKEDIPHAVTFVDSRAMRHVTNLEPE